MAHRPPCLIAHLSYGRPPSGPAALLPLADARPVAEVAKKHGVSAQTIDGWRKHFGSLEPADVKRLRQLEQENGRLQKIVADRELEIDVRKEITRKKW